MGRTSLPTFFSTSDRPHDQKNSHKNNQTKKKEAAYPQFAVNPRLPSKKINVGEEKN
jgi:hypothetical protein